MAFRARNFFGTFEKRAPGDKVRSSDRYLILLGTDHLVFEGKEEGAGRFVCARILFFTFVFGTNFFAMIDIFLSLVCSDLYSGVFFLCGNFEDS